MQENIISTFSNSYCDHIFNGTGLTEDVGFTAGLGCGASPLTLRGVCTGDDGSGLVRLDHDIRRFVLMGVLTDDPFDPDCGTREKPNVFVRVWADSILTFLWKEVFSITLASPPQIPHISQQDISEVLLLFLRILIYYYQQLPATIAGSVLLQDQVRRQFSSPGQKPATTPSW